MLTLKDISLKGHIEDGLRSEIRIGEHYSNAILLKKYGVYDCQTLSELIESGNPDFQTETFKRILHFATRRLELANAKNLNPKRYTFENYDKYPEIKNVLERADSLVSCSELPLFNPLKSQFRIQYRENLSRLNIADAKQQLGMLDINLRNSLYAQHSYLNPQKIERIANGITFYEEQLIRTALDTPNVQDYKGNLFYEKAKEKEELIEPILEDIMLYLTSASGEFIWGKMGKKDKETLLSSLHLNTELQWEIRDKFLNLIKNYVTLRELEEGIIENGTLKRFITEPKK